MKKENLILTLLIVRGNFDSGDCEKEYINSFSPFSFLLFSLKPIGPVCRVAALFSTVVAAPPKKAPLQPQVHLLLQAAPAARLQVHLQLHLSPSSLLSSSTIPLISISLPPVAGLKQALSASERGGCPSALTAKKPPSLLSSSRVRISKLKT